jgi:hypothetical protein
MSFVAVTLTVKRFRSLSMVKNVETSMAVTGTGLAEQTQPSSLQRGIQSTRQYKPFHI